VASEFFNTHPCSRQLSELTNPVSARLLTLILVLL
jgi:hypothetical protein